MKYNRQKTEKLKSVRLVTHKRRVTLNLNTTRLLITILCYILNVIYNRIHNVYKRLYIMIYKCLCIKVYITNIY